MSEVGLDYVLISGTFLDRIKPRECFRSLRFEKSAECTSRCVKWTSGAQVMIIFGRSVARTLGRSVARSLGRSVARSLDRSIGYWLCAKGFGPSPHPPLPFSRSSAPGTNMLWIRYKTDKSHWDLVWKSISTMVGPFWSQCRHWHSLNLDLSVNLIRNRAVQHASRVGGCIGIVREHFYHVLKDICLHGDRYHHLWYDRCSGKRRVRSYMPSSSRTRHVKLQPGHRPYEYRRRRHECIFLPPARPSARPSAFNFS